MFSTAASTGLFRVQGSNTVLDFYSLFFLFYMWDLLYMYLIYQPNIFYSYLTQVKVNVRRLFYPHNNKWERETTLILLSGKTEFLFCIVSSKSFQFSPSFFVSCVLMTLNVLINRSAFVHEIQVNGEFTVGPQLVDLLSEINRINAAFRNQAKGCRLRRGRPRTPSTGCHIVPKYKRKAWQ